VEAAALSREIEELERELAGLRTRVDEDNSSFSALEQQIDALRHRLTETRDAVRMRELEIAERKAALAAAERIERLESYEQDLAKLREARGRLTSGADAFLKELDSYDGEVVRLRKLLEEMREAFGEDERVTAVETALNEEAQQLGGTWEAVVSATKWRVDQKTVVEEAAREDGDLSKDLQERAEEGRASRILDYFSKS
jgi:chromosome segregation ATPase